MVAFLPILMSISTTTVFVKQRNQLRIRFLLSFCFCFFKGLTFAIDLFFKDTNCLHLRRFLVYGQKRS